MNEIHKSQYNESGSAIEKEVVFGRNGINLDDLGEFLADADYYIKLIDEVKSHVFMADIAFMTVVKTANEYIGRGSKRGKIADFYLSTKHGLKLPFSICYRANLENAVAFELNRM